MKNWRINERNDEFQCQRVKSVSSLQVNGYIHTHEVNKNNNLRQKQRNRSSENPDLHSLETSNGKEDL
ncbi:hypothetical protein ACS0TY_024809 [Phlomoides rotata]